MSPEIFTDRAWLHRRQRPTWMFEPSKLYGRLVHKTNKGTVYAIMQGIYIGKPFWVARLSIDGSGRQSWFTVEAELQATSIEFEDAGIYTFPAQGRQGRQERRRRSGTR
jgi:hypothetical protein